MPKGKLPNNILDFKQKIVPEHSYTLIVRKETGNCTFISISLFRDFPLFLLRKQVLGFYREVLRVISEEASEENRKELRAWSRHEFESKKHITDYDAIKMHLAKGRLTLKEVASAIRMAK